MVLSRAHRTGRLRRMVAGERRPCVLICTPALFTLLGIGVSWNSRDNLGETYIPWPDWCWWLAMVAGFEWLGLTIYVHHGARSIPSCFTLFFWFVCLSVCLSVCLNVCLFVRFWVFRFCIFLCVWLNPHHLQLLCLFTYSVINLLLLFIYRFFSFSLCFFLWKGITICPHHCASPISIRLHFVTFACCYFLSTSSASSALTPSVVPTPPGPLRPHRLFFRFVRLKRAVAPETMFHAPNDFLIGPKHSGPTSSIPA